jgi:hypothetical protein
MQGQNIQRHVVHTTALYELSKKWKKNEDSVEIGTDYEHQEANDLITATKKLK